MDPTGTTATDPKVKEVWTCKPQKRKLHEKKCQSNFEAGADELTDVGSRTPVLQTAITLSNNMRGDMGGSVTVGNARAEGSDISSLVATSEAHIVVLSVQNDVFVVLLGGFFDDGLDTAVGATSNTIPATGKRLGMERGPDNLLLSKALSKADSSGLAHWKESK